MANEASGNWDEVLKLYNGNHKHLIGMDPEDLEAFKEKIEKEWREKAEKAIAEQKEKVQAIDAAKKEEVKNEEQPEAVPEEKPAEAQTESKTDSKDEDSAAVVSATENSAEKTKADLQKELNILEQKKRAEQYVANRTYRSDVCKCDLNIKLKNFKEAEKLAKHGIKIHGPDSWPFLLTLCIVADNLQAEKNDATSQDIAKYIDELVEVEKAKESQQLRSPFLAQLELASRIKSTSEEDIVNYVNNYIGRFITNIILFEDIDKYLGNLIDKYWSFLGVTRFWVGILQQ